jgi:hypothetical protein
MSGPNKKKQAKLPGLTLQQRDELRLYFEGAAPSEPGSVSAYSAAVRVYARGVQDEPEPASKVEDAMLAYIDEKREWERVQAKVDACSDATVCVLAAWFAASEVDRHRVIGDDVLRAACKEFAER